MKKPDDLIQLLEELEVEITESSVEGEKSSKAVVHLEDDEDESGITLKFSECQLLLHSEATVRQMHEALGSPDEATVSLFDLTLDNDVLSALERTFSAVDEM